MIEIRAGLDSSNGNGYDALWFPTKSFPTSLKTISFGSKIKTLRFEATHKKSGLLDRVRVHGLLKELDALKPGCSNVLCRITDAGEVTVLAGTERSRKGSATPGTGVYMITGTVDVKGSVHESHGAGGALQLNLSYVQLKAAEKNGLDLTGTFKNKFDGKMNHITMQDKKHQAFIAAGTQKLSGKVMVTFTNGDYTIRQVIDVPVPPVYVNILDMPPLVWSDRQRPYTSQPGRKKRVYPRSAQIGGLTFEEQALADLQERIPADCVLRKYVDDDAEAVGYDADYYNPVLDQIVHAYEITKSQVKNLPPNQWTKAKECVETGIHPYTLLTPSGPYLFNQETLDKWEEVIVIHRKVRTRVA